jgi:hypothetical protein
VDRAPEQPHDAADREVGIATRDRAGVGNADTEEPVTLVFAGDHLQRTPDRWKPLRLGCLPEFTPEPVDAAVG